MYSKILRGSVGIALLAGLAACGSGGSGAASNTTPPVVTPQTGSMPVMISDASTEDWAMIGVQVLSIALVPQGGGAAVTVYTAPTPAPVSNLVQLDSVSDLLANATVDAGVYTGAVVTLSANPGDVTLTTSADPEAGFAAPPSTTIPSDQIQIQGASGSAGGKTVSVTVNFKSPLQVSNGQTTPLDLEFNLGHPVFLVGHNPPAAAGATLWAVNFKGPVRHHPVDDLTRLVLRHLYGTVGTVATDGSSLTVTKDLPAIPIQTPETAVSTGQSLTIDVDGTNGTMFYDVDGKTETTIKSFSAAPVTLGGLYVRVAARYQQDGSLVATRVWASSSFNKVWLSPEGHVLHVDPANNVIVVSDERGKPVPLTIDGNTNFYFRTPKSALSDATPIGTGPTFLAAQNIVRGFKVHVQASDPLAASLVAQTVDIESAVFDGQISGADATTGFTYTRRFATATDDYVATQRYIDSSTSNGKDPATGAAITGFKYWNFAYPTIVTYSTGTTSAMAEFAAATNGSVSFGGTGSCGAVTAWGASAAVWADTANPTGWSVPWAVLVPTPLARGVVGPGGYANNSFPLAMPSCPGTVTIDVSTTQGSATLAYQIDRSSGVVTVSPVDLTTSSGQQTLMNALVAGTPVKVDGIPQADGTLKAYVIAYFTGTLPTG
jgi:hypothetical protein